jgi:ABC-type branched-subunit amino acid transport system substrate-binding protein
MYGFDDIVRNSEMQSMRLSHLAAGALAAGLSLGAGPAFAQTPAPCTVTIGAVTELTGSNGAVVRPISQAQQLAIDQINEAGGVIKGCRIALDIRDSQTQPTVAVDQGRQLVDVTGVGAILGPVSSGLTLPLLTSVTVDKNVVLVTSASSSPSFTDLSHEGRTKGLFFRLQPSAALEALAAAKVASDAGIKTLSIVELNNDWGNGIVKQFDASYPALGGKILESVRFNADQPSYRSEVTKAIDAKPEGAFLVMSKTDGLKIMRDWLRVGGPQKFVFPLGVNDDQFIADVGPDVFKDSWFITPGETSGTSLQDFRTAFEAKYHISAVGPGREQGYDAAVVLALAIDAAGTAKDGAAIARAIYRVTDPAGTPVGVGTAAFKQALALIHDGKPVHYLGASGDIAFDKFGDVSSPFLAWQVRDGKLVKAKSISIADIAAVKAQTDK